MLMVSKVGNSGEIRFDGSPFFFEARAAETVRPIIVIIGEWAVQCRLERPPGEQEAALSGKAWAIADQFEHLFGRDRLGLIDRHPFDLFHEDRRGGLAEDATFGEEPGLGDRTVGGG
jgi:hypothetical protein